MKFLKFQYMFSSDPDIEHGNLNGMMNSDGNDIPENIHPAPAGTYRFLKNHIQNQIVQLYFNCLRKGALFIICEIGLEGIENATVIASALRKYLISMRRSRNTPYHMNISDTIPAGEISSDRDVQEI